jgi:hypothetical protein
LNGVSSLLLRQTTNFRKTLFHLISTLNAAFPDYDFSDAKADEFTKEPSLQVCFFFIEICVLFKPPVGTYTGRNFLPFCCCLLGRGGTEGRKRITGKDKEGRGIKKRK